MKKTSATKKSILSAVLLVCLVQVAISVPMKKVKLTEEKIVEQVNALDLGWTAKVYEQRFFLGALKSNYSKDVRVEDTIADDIPESFDSRQKWPDSIHPIRNQANCGSCWAFGATESLSDRLAIASNNQINVILSPQNLVACDKTNYGCKGGYLDRAWEYMVTEGVVTEQCYPYNIPYAAYCQISHTSTTCPSGSGAPVFYYASNYYKVDQTIAAIQTEIMTYGPVEASFTVYQDFMSYQQGVYYHTTGSAVGGHAIKILGWGVENGMPYWLCANSWGTTWGLQGYFKIYRGINECAIESDVVTGRAKV